MNPYVPTTDICVVVSRSTLTCTLNTLKALGTDIDYKTIDSQGLWTILLAPTEEYLVTLLQSSDYQSLSQYAKQKLSVSRTHLEYLIHRPESDLIKTLAHYELGIKHRITNVLITNPETIKITIVKSTCQAH